MGVQSLRDADLKALARLHTAAEARAAFDIAKTYFGRVSFDLIYARQHQSPEDWKQELGEALAMAVDHLSLYQLTIEAGTRFGDLYDLGRLRGLPTDDVSADMYEITGEVLSMIPRPPEATPVSRSMSRGSSYPRCVRGRFLLSDQACEVRTLSPLHLEKVLLLQDL